MLRRLIHLRVIFLCDDSASNPLDYPLMSTHPRRQDGFTFLWLLFLVAGLGVGMAAVGTLWHTAAQREKEKQLLFVGNEYRRAIESFQKIPLPAGQQDRLPKTLDQLLLDPRFQHTVRHLRRLYPDPITGNEEWGLLKDAQGGISGVFSQSENTPFKKQNFPTANAEFADKDEYRQWLFAVVMEPATPVNAVGAEKNAVDDTGISASQPRTMPQAPQSGGTGDPDHATGASNRQRDICSKEFQQAKLLQCAPHLKANQWSLYRSCITTEYLRYRECLDGG